MDYPLHYTTSTEQENSTSNNHNNTGTSNSHNNYRSYGVFSDRSDLLFDHNSSASPTIDPLEVNNEDRSRSSMVLLSTRPPPLQQVMHDSWNQHQNQQLHHSINNTFNPNDIHSLSHHPHHHNMSHSERGIAGFVSKLYQCLQSTDTNQKYSRWIQHEGKDMFIIDNIPEFTEVVLPRLFKHCKFPSFVRQLNIYGFQRDTDARKSKDTRDKESCRWFHPCFRPGRRDLFHLIRRKATRYSRKKRVKVEEDPETILNLGSGDEEEESDAEPEENAMLLVTPHEEQQQEKDEQFCSSSASSVVANHSNAMPPPIDYNTSSSQLQLGFHTNDSAPSTSLIHHNHHTSNMPLNVVIPEESGNAEDGINRLLNISTPTMQHHQQDVVSSVARDQELRQQILHIKRQYERMHGKFEEQLKIAQNTIEDQKIRIQQLEGALRLTKQEQQRCPLNLSESDYMTVTPMQPPNNSAFNSSGSGGGGNFFNRSSSSRVLAQQRSLFEYNKSESSSTSTPRPTIIENSHHFYFQQENKNNVQIKAENNDNNHHHLLHTPPPASSSWGAAPFIHHRDTNIDKSSTANGIVTAGSNTVTTSENSTIIDTSNSITSSPSTNNHLHHQHHSRGGSSKPNLSNHMNLYDSYM